MKIFGWFISIFAILGLIWDFIAARILNQAITGFTSGDIIMWVLEFGCLVSGFYLLRGGKGKWWYVLSIACFTLLVLDITFNIIITLHKMM